MACQQTAGGTWGFKTQPVATSCRAESCGRGGDAAARQASLLRVGHARGEERLPFDPQYAAGPASQRAETHGLNGFQKDGKAVDNRPSPSRSDCDLVFGFNQRHVHQVLADKPHLQFVGAQNITDHEIVGALVTEVGSPLGKGAAVSNDDVMGIEQP